MELTSHKIIALVLLGAISLFFGLLPLKFKRWIENSKGSNRKSKRQAIISGLLCFGAGVLLATVFLHILPETKEGFQRAKNMRALSEQAEAISMELNDPSMGPIAIPEIVTDSLSTKSEDETQEADVSENHFTEDETLDNDHTIMPPSGNVDQLIPVDNVPVDARLSPPVENIRDKIRQRRNAEDSALLPEIRDGFNLNSGSTSSTGGDRKVVVRKNTRDDTHKADEAQQHSLPEPTQTFPQNQRSFLDSNGRDHDFHHSEHGRFQNELHQLSRKSGTELVSDTQANSSLMDNHGVDHDHFHEDQDHIPPEEHGHIDHGHESLLRPHVEASSHNGHFQGHDHNHDHHEQSHGDDHQHDGHSSVHSNHDDLPDFHNQENLQSSLNKDGLTQNHTEDQNLEHVNENAFENAAQIKNKEVEHIPGSERKMDHNHAIQDHDHNHESVHSHSSKKNEPLRLNHDEHHFHHVHHGQNHDNHGNEHDNHNHAHNHGNHNHAHDHDNLDNHNHDHDHDSHGHDHDNHGNNHDHDHDSHGHDHDNHGNNHDHDNHGNNHANENDSHDHEQWKNNNDVHHKHDNHNHDKDHVHKQDDIKDPRSHHGHSHDEDHGHLGKNEALHHEDHSKGHGDHGDHDYPYPELTICLGFFLIYIVEEVVHKFIGKNSDRHSLSSSSVSTIEEDIESRLHSGGQGHSHIHIPAISNNKNKKKKGIFGKNSSQVCHGSTPGRYLKGQDNLAFAGDINAATWNPSLKEAVTSLQESSSQSSSSNSNSTSIDLPDCSSRKQSSADDITITKRSITRAIFEHFRTLLVILALSIHGIFEGMVVGLQENVADTWYITFAISAHHFVISFCIGMEMIIDGAPVLLMVIYMVVLSLVVPVGTCIGLLVTANASFGGVDHELVVAILQGMAGGTILYVVFLEILEKERQKRGRNFTKLISLIFGFTFMAIIQAFSSHSHGSVDQHGDHIH